MTRRWTYHTIAIDVEDRIERREYAPGTRIPSYRELSLIYGVSIATAQRAVRLLRLAGVAVGQQGRGVFVADR
jgi:DNA-binding GntR family transcriptional regulator